MLVEIHSNASCIYFLQFLKGKNKKLYKKKSAENAPTMEHVTN